MKKVTVNNTKSDILDAYNEALDKIKELESRKVDTAKEIQKNENAETIKSAEEIIGLGILNSEVVDKYNKLNKAIELKEAELANLHAIEVEIHSLNALVNAHVDLEQSLKTRMEEKRTELEREYSQRIADTQKDIKELQLKYEELGKELRKKYSDEEKELKQKRERDLEEYKYNLDRDKKIENDKWEDEKADREKVLADKEKTVAIREEKMDELQETVEHLQAKVEEIPTLVENAKAEGAEAKSKELEKVHAIKESSLKKDCEWEKKMLQQQVDSLQSELAKSHAREDELNAKLNQSYKEMNELATQTVKSSGVKILETGNSKGKE